MLFPIIHSPQAPLARESAVHSRELPLDEPAPGNVADAIFLPDGGAEGVAVMSDMKFKSVSLGINLSQACESFLRDYIKRAKERRWLEQNAVFIAAHNERAEKEGLTLAEWRTF
jgi:antitoxin CcdA